MKQQVIAKATRSGDWWAVEVPEVPGLFTQAKRLEQVPAMVRDAVSLLTDFDADEVEVELPTDLRQALDEAHRGRGA